MVIKYIDDSGIRINGERIGVVPTLGTTHKLRFTKSGTVYGIPLLATTDPFASSIRIFDGSEVKSLGTCG